MLMGNSQTQMTSLARGEAPPSGPEKTYTDLMADHYRQNGSTHVFYRLSAGALSYQEMLWYVAYLASRPAIQPNVLLVQLNYQNFTNGGIRHGMLELLSDPEFRQKIETFAHSGRPDADAFLEALQQWENQQRSGGPADAQSAKAAKAPNAGDVLETGIYHRLEQIPGFDRRVAFKSSFVYMLYRGRSYFLRMQPATRRSLGGARVAASRAALEDLLEICKSAGIRVVLFHAPTNPATPLYGTGEDDRSYHEFAASLAARYGVPTSGFRAQHRRPLLGNGTERSRPSPSRTPGTPPVRRTPDRGTAPERDLN